jgi:hypothetical protein
MTNQVIPPGHFGGFAKQPQTIRQNIKMLETAASCATPQLTSSLTSVNFNH